MSNRPIIEPLEQIRSFDQEWGWKDALIGLAYQAQALLGGTATQLFGLLGSQTSSPSMTINIGQGQVYQLAQTDATVYGALPGDSALIMQQGVAQAGTLPIVNTCGAGQSQWILVEVGFAQVDAIRAGDPDSGIPPYVNVADPADPFAGQNNSGLPQNTVREGTVVIQAKNGAAATTGSQVPPSADTGFAPLYLINISVSTTAITTSMIQLAGPNVSGPNASGYPNAPLCPGLLGTLPGATGSHHGGIAGQAEKINLPTEAQGIANYSNLPCSNSSPPAVAGPITSVSLPVALITTENPNGNITGAVGDYCFNSSLLGLWVCTVAGSANWVQIGGPSLCIVATNNFTAQPGNIYLCSTGTAFTATLGLASTFGGVPVSFRNIGTNPLTITPASADSIEGGAAAASYVLQPNESIKLGPQSGVGFWEVI